MTNPPINDSPNCPEHGDTMELLNPNEKYEHWGCTECDYEINNEPDYEE